VGVHAGEAQAEFGLRGQHFIEVFVPDAETGRWTAYIGAVAVPGAESRINADAYLRARLAFPVGAKLVQGAGVELHAPGKQVTEIFRQFLRCELDVFARHARAHGPLRFEPAARVDMQAHAVKYLNHRRRRQGFHGVAGR
jgi:hypothetical protein